MKVSKTAILHQFAVETVGLTFIVVHQSPVDWVKGSIKNGDKQTLVCIQRESAI
jgi:hypothetical protein